LADPPRGEEEWIPVDPNFTHGVDLVSYIRSSREFSSYFCIGVAGHSIYLRVVPALLIHVFILGYPDGHDKDTAEDVELNYLKAKVDAGADFIMTQLFYDVDGFVQWVKKVRAKGQLNFDVEYMVCSNCSGINVPIIPGIMPIQTYSSFLRLIKLCGTKVPPAISAALEPIRVGDNISPTRCLTIIMTVWGSMMTRKSKIMASHWQLI
jgi:methylenetetrahydrofolate reductase (NADPH)